MKGIRDLAINRFNALSYISRISFFRMCSDPLFINLLPFCPSDSLVHQQKFSTFLSIDEHMVEGVRSSLRRSANTRYLKVQLQMVRQT